ncbi:ly6/PLAUR domain-containing protein 1 isoform X4 [Gopherus flavomarginatus]|uniref:ly6/PLAUR domain-containing protein 1 isoform X4 n=1 Tax=Gopherus flavomarginatus TaxID=286002 RepID=UPI0021CBCC6D|nr:ly6/PLAUR domain-containing protein 1 isoform X4 [Gopherus flavomarginatus]
MWLLFGAATFWGLVLAPGFGLQIQCYQCEEFQLNNDCSAPEFIVNCTVNVQDMCQKEVMEKSSAGESPWLSCCRFSHPTHSRMQQREEVLPVQAGAWCYAHRETGVTATKPRREKRKLAGGV